MMFGGEFDFDDESAPAAGREAGGDPRPGPDPRADARALMAWGGFLFVCAALFFGLVLKDRRAPVADRPAAAEVVRAD